MEIERLPKGHSLDFVFDKQAITLDHRALIGSDAFADDSGCIHVSAFVSGDTPEKGLSIVALHNPEWCLFTMKDAYYNTDPEDFNLIRSEIASGYCHDSSRTVAECTKYQLSYLRQPTCPY